MFINSFDCSFFQSSNVKCLLSDRHFLDNGGTVVKGKERRERESERERKKRGGEQGRKGRRGKGGEGHVIKSNGTRVTTETARSERPIEGGAIV